jgi:FYVE, RhoGEF and PH domain containing 5/6
MATFVQRLSGKRDTSSPNAIRISKRAFHIDEVIKTERTYVERLQAVQNHVITPLRALTICTPDEIDAQFPNWNTILEFHLAFLIRLETQATDDLNALNIGKLLQEFSGHLQEADYGTYLVGYQDAREERARWLIKRKKFSDFVVECHGRLTGIGSLENLLSEPIMRIPRYRLLLEQIIKVTEPTDKSSLDDLNAALDGIKEVASACNDAIAEKVQKDTLMEYMMKMDWRKRINFLEIPGRVFLKEGFLNRQTRRTLKNFEFWLFSDAFMWGENQGLGFYYHREVNLREARLSVPNGCVGEFPSHVWTFDLAKEFEAQGGMDRAFQIESPQKSFMVWASNRRERDDWVIAIADAIDTCRKQFESETKDIAPVWIPDRYAKGCWICKKEFGFVNRRHHCRRCGNVICGSCSKNSVVLEYTNNEAVRVCDDCFTVRNTMF